MKNPDRDRFDGRLKNATEAKRNSLERFKAAQNDPKRLEKRAQREELAAARAVVRQAKAAKQLQEKEALEKVQAKKAKHEEAQAAKQQAAIVTEEPMTADEIAAQTKAREAAQKAERDRRYAARKNRKR